MPDTQPEEEEEVCTCERCDQSIPEGDPSYQVKTTNTLYETWCQDCYDNYAATCLHCEENSWTDRMTCIGDDWACEHCYNEYNYGSCSHCEDHYRNLNYVESEQCSYCDECYDNLFTDCASCEESYRNRALNDGLCSECYDTCRSCGDSFDDSDSMKLIYRRVGCYSYYCDTCAQETLVLATCSVDTCRAQWIVSEYLPALSPCPKCGVDYSRTLAGVPEWSLCETCGENRVQDRTSRQCRQCSYLTPPSYSPVHEFSNYTQYLPLEHKGNVLIKFPYGIEFETTNGLIYQLEAHKRMPGLVVKDDGSLRGKAVAELCTPVLSGDNSLKTLKEFLEIPFEVNSSCGTHIHLGVEEIHWKDLLPLMKYVLAWEEQFRLLVSYDRRSNRYCSPVSWDSSVKAEKVSSQLEFLGYIAGSVKKGALMAMKAQNEKKAPEPSRAGRRSLPAPEQLGSPSRYAWFNVLPYFYQGSIEIRLHHGTVDYEEIKRWILFWQYTFRKLIGAPMSSGVFKKHPLSLLPNAEPYKSIKDYYTNEIRERGELCAEFLESSAIAQTGATYSGNSCSPTATEVETLRAFSMDVFQPRRTTTDYGSSLL